MLNDLDFYDDNPTLFVPEPVITDEDLTKWKNELSQLESLLRTHAIKVAEDVDFNDNFLEVINGSPVNLSEIKLPKRIEVSSIQQEIRIPNLKTMPLDDAIKEIAREKLPLVVNYVHTEVANATQTIVTDTNPIAGTIAKPGDKLSISYTGPKEIRLIRREVAMAELIAIHR
jgi:hypothetical protein